MGYSLDPISDDCYPGTTVLINKLDIRDEATLDEAETLATYINAAKLEEHPLVGAFDFSHYRAIHYFLFSELYDWAGQIRTVNISKMGTSFCPAEEIERQAQLVFQRLADCNFFRGLPHGDFVEKVVDFYCATNLLHPFRGGQWPYPASVSHAADSGGWVRHRLGRGRYRLAHVSHHSVGQWRD